MRSVTFGSRSWIKIDYWNSRILKIWFLYVHQRQPPNTWSWSLSSTSLLTFFPLYLYEFKMQKKYGQVLLQVLMFARIFLLSFTDQTKFRSQAKHKPHHLLPIVSVNHLRQPTKKLPKLIKNSNWKKFDSTRNIIQPKKVACDQPRMAPFFSFRKSRKLIRSLAVRFFWQNKDQEAKLWPKFGAVTKGGNFVAYAQWFTKGVPNIEHWKCVPKMLLSCLKLFGFLIWFYEHTVYTCPLATL